LTEDTYLSIEKQSEGFFKDRGSKFIAYALPVSNEDEIKVHLNFFRELHPKAVHHCYAWRLGPEKDRYRSSDDGEPSGSAGKPILNTLYSSSLSDVLVLVVRYFGGSLLGIPGLIHAYKTASEDALNAATIIQRHITNSYRLVFPYESMNDVMKIVKDLNLEIENPSFEMTCEMTVRLRTSLYENFMDRASKIRTLEIGN
jgi:uncharacterized YigZ family protein